MAAFFAVHFLTFNSRKVNDTKKILMILSIKCTSNTSINASNECESILPNQFKYQILNLIYFYVMKTSYGMRTPVCHYMLCIPHVKISQRK